MSWKQYDDPGLDQSLGWQGIVGYGRVEGGYGKVDRGYNRVDSRV